MRNFLVLAALCACGGGGGGSLPLAELEVEFTAAFCEQMARCCTAQDRAFLEEGLGPAEECGDGWRQFVAEEKYLTEFQAAVAAGQFRYDEAAGYECVEHLRSMSCGDWGSFVEEQNAAAGVACMTMFEPVCPPLDDALCAGIAEGQACDPQCEDLFQCSGGFCRDGLLCSPVTSTCEQDPELVPAQYCTGA